MTSKAEQWRAQAKEALDKFYADRDEILAKNKKVNRENADALRVEQEDFDPNDGKTDQAKWELVTQRIDFNAKGNFSWKNIRFIFINFIFYNKY